MEIWRSFRTVCGSIFSFSRADRLPEPLKERFRYKGLMSASRLRGAKIQWPGEMSTEICSLESARKLEDH